MMKFNCSVSHTWGLVFRSRGGAQVLHLFTTLSLAGWLRSFRGNVWWSLERAHTSPSPASSPRGKGRRLLPGFRGSLPPTLEKQGQRSTLSSRAFAVTPNSSGRITFLPLPIPFPAPVLSAPMQHSDELETLLFVSWEVSVVWSLIRANQSPPLPILEYSYQHNDWFSWRKQHTISSLPLQTGFPNLELATPTPSWGIPGDLAG